MKKVFKIISIILLVIIIIGLASFIPTLYLRNNGMVYLDGNWVNVYYQKEEAAAMDVYSLAETRASYLIDKLGFSEKQEISIYIYDQQSTFQMKKYGLVALLLNLDWYVGDNKGSNVLLTSPANPGELHDYEDVKEVVLHEMVHAYVYLINPKIQLWLTEGVALYLSNGTPLTKEVYEESIVPSFNNTKTSNPIEFANCGGYTFAHIYIEFLDETYGWEKTLQLITSQDYKQVFNKSDVEIYNDWISYLEATYN